MLSNHKLTGISTRLAKSRPLSPVMVLYKSEIQNWHKNCNSLREHLINILWEAVVFPWLNPMGPFHASVSINWQESFVSILIICTICVLVESEIKQWIWFLVLTPYFWFYFPEGRLEEQRRAKQTLQEVTMYTQPSSRGGFCLAENTGKRVRNGSVC